MHFSVFNFSSAIYIKQNEILCRLREKSWGFVILSLQFLIVLVKQNAKKHEKMKKARVTKDFQDNGTQRKKNMTTSTEKCILLKDVAFIVSFNLCYSLWCLIFLPCCSPKRFLLGCLLAFMNYLFNHFLLPTKQHCTTLYY